MAGLGPGHEGLLPVSRSCIPRDLDYPAYIGLQRFRNHDRALVVLIGFHHRDERAAHGDARAVEGVDVPDALLRAVARIHAPRLEFAAHRTGRDFTIGILPRQPDLDVVSLLRGETHVAS